MHPIVVEWYIFTIATILDIPKNDSTAWHQIVCSVNIDYILHELVLSFAIDVVLRHHRETEFRPL